MLITSWKRLFGQTRRPVRSRPRLRLETLEGRLVPSATPNLSYNGGPVVQHVKVEAVYYSPWDTKASLEAQRQVLDDFFKYITTSGYIKTLLGQYSTTSPAQTIHNGSFLGDDFNGISVTGKDSSTGNLVLNDTAIHTMLSSEIGAGKVPAPDANTIYFVFPAPGVEVTKGTKNSVSGFAGYHNSFSNAGQNVYYAVIPYYAAPNDPGLRQKYPALRTLDKMTIASSHELSEAITDPIPGQSWSSHTEVGDLAHDYQVLVHDKASGYDFTVQQEWSNKTGAPASPHGTVSGVFGPAVPDSAIPDAPLTTLSFTPPSVSAGQTVTGFTALHFWDADPDGQASDFKATVVWGDGTPGTTLTSKKSSAGRIVADPQGGFDVVISHDYQQAPGGFTITVKDKFSPDNNMGTGKVTHHAQLVASSGPTIDAWTFSDHGVSLAETTGSVDHTELSAGSASGGSSFSGAAVSTITAAAGEKVNVHLDVSGLTIVRGSLTVTVTIGDVSQSVTVTSSRDVQQDFGSFNLTGGGEELEVTFAWSVGAQYVFTSGTRANLRFH